MQALFWSAIPQVPLPASLLNMICTNVPGPPAPLYAIGKKMIACYPHVPTGYELGVNCAVQSYNDRLFCGLTADAVVVPDAEKLRDLIHASFLDLRRSVGIGQARRTRRPPPAAPPQKRAAAAD
jgi:hypothetical protein